MKERQREAKNESEVFQGQIMGGVCAGYRVWIRCQCFGEPGKTLFMLQSF